MSFHIDDIILPALRVDMIFDINSEMPYSRSSTIYDVDPDKQTVIIAQPNIPLTKDTVFKELHLTGIIQDKNRKIRLGVKCRSFKLIDNFTLANKTRVPAIVLTYELPVKETNIRSAFRLPLNTKYLVKGKLLYKNDEYYTSSEFSIKNISLSGLGLLIPKRIKNRHNPLSDIKINEQIIMGIILIDRHQDKPINTLAIKTQVVRINPDDFDTCILAGLEIIDLKKDKETVLNRFIHNAQIDALKIRSRRT